ncbi:MAG: UDP-N-acetylmuramoyl-L-alanine--D-glutamate ligase, partial [Oligoflexia bacterium]|nr:UDP-N-acetylmuramoyl-L-alanine--D-glutamate ligase [Oligoflexia bacterium]
MSLELSYLKDKQILIVGLAKTGVSLAHFLVKNGAKVTISDHKSEAELARYLEQVKDLPLQLELEGHAPKSFLNKHHVILSPGIPSHLKLFEYIKAQGVEVTGEFEFCARFTDTPLLVVTGTNGKTTTADLIYRSLKESGKSPWAGGNFGEPLSRYLYEGEKADFLVIEASSFMLEHINHTT